MGEIKSKIDDLVAVMEEFGLDSAKMAGEDWSVEFSRELPAGAGPVAAPDPGTGTGRLERTPKPPKGQAPSGIPVNSPTTGIFYSSPNPGAPAFVKVGDTVEAGQVIGLIEAMKVFNEITATVSGTVQRVVAQNGQLVQPGDPLLYIG